MLNIQENISLRPKTTMKIGGVARYYAEPKTKAELEEAIQFAKEKEVPVIPLGAGSNTIFADGTINALIIRIIADDVAINKNLVTVSAGKYLAMLINELAEQNLDLSSLTGIPGTIGGATFGNAGQGPKGIWIDAFIESVTAYIDGTWKILSREDCQFRYRESYFKDNAQSFPIIWEVTLNVPSGDRDSIKATIESLLQKRIETQPHVRTAGSCFKAVGETPAWKLIDAANLRGFKIGNIEISTKHANFLISDKNPNFADAKALIQKVKELIPEGLEVEMRCVEEDGSLAH
ncbi:MAG TPA: UDP-N-acetylmuramate dehydrogenase [Candidatus Peribacterales bacterium]|nr:UDP-N-acetylmuramate dehydrogenase [Candidatus Peribacterales bacterium]